jgi:hypothetical protein
MFRRPCPIERSPLPRQPQDHVAVPEAGHACAAATAGLRRYRPGRHGIRLGALAFQTFGRMKSRDEHLTWAKQRALVCVDMGDFAHAVTRADLDEHPLTQGVMSSDQALRGFKAAMDAALGRGSQALTGWIEGLR